MNSSLVILLLFLSTCHGKEQDRSPPSGISPTTKSQENVEALSEDSCPDPTDIEPCECSPPVSRFDYPNMTCSNVQDEEQLRKVFSASFPTTELYEFKMWNNTGVKVLEDGVFGNVQFHHLDIQDSVLETVMISALTPSLSTLTQISIRSCMLEIFPFERLSKLTTLKHLILSSNNIHTVPPFSNNGLQTLYLDYNSIAHLKPEVFTSIDNIGAIYLNNNQLREIVQGTFAHASLLDLRNNSIDYVQVDAFEGVPPRSEIYMNNNALIRLPEEVWRPVLEWNIEVNLAGNDLACGCDLAWLVREKDLLAKTIDGRCDDGTLLIDLLSTDFDICD